MVILQLPAFRIPSVEISSPILIKSELLAYRGASNNGSDWMLGFINSVVPPFWQLASPLQS
jgi:hypothetical protein